MPDPLKELIDKASDIITAASHNPLGIVALFILGSFIVGYLWFKPESTRVRIGIYLAMIASALVFFLVGLHGSSAIPKRGPTPEPGTATASAQQVTFVGRVQERVSLLPVQGAEAHIYIGQNFGKDEADSDGIFRVRFKQVNPDSDARLQVEAAGYRTYDLHLAADSASSFLIVRMDPIKPASPASATPPASAAPTARKASYAGRALDETTRAPIVGAKVVLGVRPPAYTDSEGAFFFDLPTKPKGPLTLQISAQGYVTYDLTVGPGDAEKSIDVRMKKGESAQH